MSPLRQFAPDFADVFGFTHVPGFIHAVMHHKPAVYGEIVVLVNFHVIYRLRRQFSYFCYFQRVHGLRIYGNNNALAHIC